jgi:hypothetical protein
MLTTAKGRHNQEKAAKSPSYSEQIENIHSQKSVQDY